MTESHKYNDNATGGFFNVFKKKYGKYEDNFLNRTNPFNARIKTKNDIAGDGEQEWSVDAGFIGGAGGGTLRPTTNRGFYLKPKFSPYRLHVSAEIDGLTDEMSKQDGSWIETKPHVVKKVLEKYQWFRSFSHWGDGDGSLGTINGAVTDNGGGSYSFAITSGSWRRRFWNRRELVNIGAGTTSKFEITNVAYSTRTITVQRVEGSDNPTAYGNGKVFLQGCENQMPVSLVQISNFQSSSLFGVSYAEDIWAPVRVDAASATISVDFLNECALRMEEVYGRPPTAIYVPFAQKRKMLNSMEDRKNYITEGGSAKNRKGDYSFSALLFHGAGDDAIPILTEPFAQEDRIYMVVEDEYVEHRTASSPFWEKDDKGNMVFHKDAKDAYELRYKSYQSNTCHPGAVGVIHTLG